MTSSQSHVTAGRDNITQMYNYEGPVDSGNKGRVRAVTAWVEQAPIDDSLWTVKVHNGTRGPITDLVVDVYVVDDEGNRTGGECVPAKQRISLGDLFARLLPQFLSPGLGAIGAQAQANPWMQGFPQGGMPDLSAYGGMLAGVLSSDPRVRARLAQEQEGMKDTFPKVVSSQQETQVLYFTETGDQVRVDIAFDDEDGQRWFRRFGEGPTPVAT